MRALVGFLLGSPPGAASLLPRIRSLLAGRGCRTLVHVLADQEPVPGAFFSADLVALRALDLEALETARSLERAGIRCCNSVGATARARDKAFATRVLSGVGLPVPHTELFAGWSQARWAARGRSVAVKAAHGSRGGAVLLASSGSLPPAAPFPGPYILQELVEGDGLDRKLYVVGRKAAGVARCWPAESLDAKLGAPFAPGADLRNLALAAGAALGLEVFGVDIVVGAAGPVLVDVNAFPGFKGVEAAPAWIADHLRRAANDGEPACAS